MQKAGERLYLTPDRGELVGEGDKRAAFLYAAKGDEIPDSAAKRFGLTDGMLKGRKQRAADEDKERRQGSNKGGDAGELTTIKGIGAAKAKALGEAGISTVAQLAAVDPKNPPAMIAGVGEVEWVAWVAAAGELVASTGQD